jgi:hypothetical protein
MRKSNVSGLSSIAIGLILAVSGCGGSNLPDYNLLASLRVLALQADKPEAHPGDTVTITPYASDINGGGRALTFSAEACLDPGTAYGATPSCLGNPTRVVLNTQSAAAALPGQATGATTTIAVSIPATLLTGQSTQNIYNGVSYLFLYQLFGGSETVTAFKHILVVDPSKATLNSNPDSAGALDILFNGAASATVVTLPSGDQSLSLQYPAGAIEAYQLKKSDGSFQSLTESLTTTWFVTDGSENHYRSINSGTTTWTPPGGEPTSRKVVLAAVIRDGRGGVSFLKKEF